MVCAELKLLRKDPLGEEVITSVVLPGDCSDGVPWGVIVEFGVLKTPEPPNMFWFGVPNTLAGLPPKTFPVGEANKDCEVLFLSFD